MSKVRVTRMIPDPSVPCLGQGCRNDATWRIGVPAAVMYLCEPCVREMQDQITPTPAAWFQVAEREDRERNGT